MLLKTSSHFMCKHFQTKPGKLVKTEQLQLYKNNEKSDSN